jgi:hypothetical protein
MDRENVLTHTVFNVLKLSNAHRTIHGRLFAAILFIHIAWIKQFTAVIKTTYLP